MLLDDPGNIRGLNEHLAFYSTMRSFAGELDGPLLEITNGRTDRWKNVYRLKSPNLGLHYYGHYGVHNEDCYFSKITGCRHEFFGANFERYPYSVGDSGLKISHFSD